jgi:hypothetical protein
MTNHVKGGQVLLSPQLTISLQMSQRFVQNYLVPI